MTTTAFTDNHHRAIGLFSGTLACLGFHCVVVADHDDCEELAEVQPIGEDIVVMMVHPLPPCQ